MQPKFANLEFRKVPSLKYLYEISEDGRYVRNVKSKKYRMVSAGKVCVGRNYQICSIARLLAETFPRPQRVGVSLTEGGSTNTFASISAASRYIAETKGVKAESARNLLKRRRSHILGFDVTYRNAETVRQQP